MAVRIIYGKPGTGKSERCFSEIANRIKDEKKIYMITPEQFSFTAEKKLMDAIQTHAITNAEVVTLSRMAYRVINEVGGNKTHLSKCGKAMLIYSLLNQYRKELKFLGKSDENIDLSMRTMTEFKKHGITVEKLQEEMKKLEDPYLKSKLEDMTLIYEKFEEQIAENYIEETDLLDILVKEIGKTNIIQDSIIYLDEFAGFTSQEYEVLKEMMKQAKEVTITICTDELAPSMNPDTDIYYSNKQTMQKIVRAANEVGVKIEEPIFLAKQHRLKTPELIHLSRNIGQMKSTKHDKNVENLSLFLAKNQYSEIENMAKKITKLIKEEGLRYRDIGIITKNISDYASLVKIIFDKYDIPVFIDEKRDVSQNIIIQYVLSIVEVLLQNFSQESVFSYLKLGFTDIDQDEIVKLEMYCIKWGIKYHKWKKDFVYEIDDESKKQEIERWNEIRKNIVNPLLELKEKIEEEKKAENITKQLYSFIKMQNIEEQIHKRVNRLREKNLIDLANEHIASYNIIMQTLDEIVLVFGKQKITIDQYIQILKIGFKNRGLGKIPGTQDQVILGDVERSRSHKIKALFIIGLNDGIFPSVKKDEGFFGDDDREKLKQDGIELAKGSMENLYEENFNIYKAFTTAEEKLYLSYSSADLEGKSLRPSIYIHRIKKIFPKVKEVSDIIEKNYEITNEKATYEELIKKIANQEKGEKIEPLWDMVYQYYQSQNGWKEKMEQDLKGLQYTNQPEQIDSKVLEKLYGNILHTSVSRLERYQSCPFSYFLQYGLKLKEKEELKVQNFDTGSFMHEIIEGFFELVRDKNMNLPELMTEEDKIAKIVNEVIEEKLDFGRKYRFTETAKYKILLKRLKRTVTKALTYIIEGIVSSDFTIEGSEIEFGQRGTYKPIILTLENGKKIEITGKIDRIDTATAEEGNYLRIIDYKTYEENIDLNEVYAGLQIQLLTYMDAICKQEDIMPAGVLYFNLLEQMVKASKKMTEEQIEEEIRKKFKMKGIILEDVKVIQMQDNTLETGTSKIIPAALTVKGEINKARTNGVSKDEFEILQRYMNKTIKQIGTEIFRGRIEIKPYYKKGKTPCEYCSYHPICGFDARNEGNHYQYIDKRSKDEVMEKMKEELGENKSQIK